MTDNEALIALLEIRTKIEECRKQGLWLTVNTLRHQAMTLAEGFVDPAWVAEQEQDQIAARKAVLFNIGCPQEV